MQNKMWLVWYSLYIDKKGIRYTIFVNNIRYWILIKQIDSRCI